MSPSIEEQIADLRGPILVLGASGFVGANLLRSLLAVREDVVGTALRLPSWRLAGLPERHVAACDLLARANVRALLDQLRPATVFNLAAYGAYSFERDAALTYRTNVMVTVELLEELAQRRLHRYVHAGSSSEYGKAAGGPGEEQAPRPNSHYAASKAAAAGLIYFLGTERGFPGAHLRLYSVYGPWEDSSRLVPTVVSQGVEGRLPPFVDPSISRDFVFVDDATAAFVRAALALREESYGESFNIGTGVQTTIGEVAETARRIFGIEAEPEFSHPPREWDVPGWFANPEKARRLLGWEATVGFEEGLERTARWYRELEDPEAYLRSTKKLALDPERSISAVVACYRDGPAVPVMYERLTRVFLELGVDYEIVFVNDASPDDAEERIRELSARDPRVIGITHSRNFGSQAAFRSGMEAATKNACVLLDGDLQDPPELIGDFVEKWREGFDVVYGRRVQREASWPMQIAYKLFYRIFDRFSYVPIPKDAGDFSLLDRKVVRRLLQFPERDLFLRGLRAFVGFRQTGVDYVRPERMFGRTTNSLWKNIGWAKKGILSFTYTPLDLLSVAGVLSLLVFLVLAAVQVGTKLLFPGLAPRGLTTIILLVLFFGALNLFAVSLLGEYLAKILEEVKRRPHFIRSSLIRDGEILEAADELPEPE